MWWGDEIHHQCVQAIILIIHLKILKFKDDMIRSPWIHQPSRLIFCSKMSLRLLLSWLNPITGFGRMTWFLTKLTNNSRLKGMRFTFRRVLLVIIVWLLPVLVMKGSVPSRNMSRRNNRFRSLLVLLKNCFMIHHFF